MISAYLYSNHHDLTEKLDHLSKENEILTQDITALKTLIAQQAQVLDSLFSEISKLNLRIKNIESSLPNITYSTIVKESEINFLYIWLEDFKPQGFELLYRGTRDGFSSQAILSKVKGLPNTRDFIESTCGMRGGGFLDSPRGDFTKWIGSNKAFIFSLDNRTKKKIVKNHLAFHDNKEYLVWFGDGAIGVYAENE